MDELEIHPQITTPEPDFAPGPESTPSQTVSIEEWIASGEPGIEEPPPRQSLADAQLAAVLEAMVYVAEEPLTVAQVAAALNQEPDRIRAIFGQLVAEFDRPEHGVSIREVAGGYKMATKPEHHEVVRSFVKSLKAPLKLSLPALETLAVIAYKQPVTTPEIMEIRGVQGGGVLKTLLDRKLITEAGRKNVIGKPILYKTTKDFLIQFGLKDLSELPSLKEFEEIRRMSMADDVPADAPAPEQSRLALAQTAETETPAGDGAATEAEARAAADEQSAPEAEASAAAAEPSGERPAPEADVSALALDVSATAAVPSAGELPAPEADASALALDVSATAAEVPAGEQPAPEADASAFALDASAAAAVPSAGERPAIEADASALALDAAAAAEPTGEQPEPAPPAPAPAASAPEAAPPAQIPEAPASPAAAAPASAQNPGPDPESRADIPPSESQDR